MPTMTVAEAVRFMKDESHGRFFSVKFVKRTTGQEREMLCRIGVRSHLAGGERAYDPAQHHLLCVFDVQRNDYRSINLDGLISVKVNGVVYQVVKDPKEQGE